MNDGGEKGREIGGCYRKWRGKRKRRGKGGTERKRRNVYGFEKD